jgi:hypothetical protein
MKRYRVIYSEVNKKYLAQGMVNSDAINVDSWLKIGDWVETLSEAKRAIIDHCGFEKAKSPSYDVHNIMFEYEVEE